MPHNCHGTPRPRTLAQNRSICAHAISHVRTCFRSCGGDHARTFIRDVKRATGWTSLGWRSSLSCLAGLPRKSGGPQPLAQIPFPQPFGERGQSRPSAPLRDGTGRCHRFNTTDHNQGRRQDPNRRRGTPRAQLPKIAPRGGIQGRRGAGAHGPAAIGSAPAQS